MGCNWKVFVDNYLDGGYHVPVLHKDLTETIDFSSYQTQVEEYFSVQRVTGDQEQDERIGKGAIYLFMYPNFMINRSWFKKLKSAKNEVNWLLKYIPSR